MTSIVETHRLLAACGETSRELASHEAHLDQLRGARDDAVRAALAVEHLYQRDIAKAAGVSRQYVTLLAKERRAAGDSAPAIDDDEPWEDMVLEALFGVPEHGYVAFRSFAAMETQWEQPFTADEARGILERIDELGLDVPPGQREHLERRRDGVESAR